MVATEAQACVALENHFVLAVRVDGVDTTFVQYYPTLIDVAKQKGTYKNVD